MKEKFSRESQNLNQSFANENVSDGGPNEPTDVGKGPTPDVGANLNNETGAEISEKTPHLKPRYESESLDAERSGSTAPDKDKTSLSSLAGRATGPSTPTRPPCKPGQNRNPSDTPKSLPISGLYAEFAQKPLPEELRTERNLEEGATFGDAVAAALFAAAIKGSVPAARELRESVEGKANQRRTAVAEEKFEVLVTYEKPPVLKMLPKGSPDAPHEETS
jgi:hypothetical protein